MAQINIKQIRGASQGSLIFLGTNSVLSENYNRLNWDQNTNQLFVNGQLKIQDGNQSNGYVLTSDSNGLASWALPASGITGASNGLSLINNEVLLGGTISQTTNINGDSNILNLVNFDYIFFTSSVFDVESDMISLDAGTGSIQLIANDSINLAVINGDILISATVGTVNIGNGEGLVYVGDYSGTFVTNSLVSRKYVDDGTASIWSAIDSLTTGNITGVTAGLGLTGGGDSGYVTLSIELASNSGLTFSGNSLTIDPSIANVGLTYSSGSMSIDLSIFNIATGSGTANYFPKWNTTNNLSSTSSIYDNDGKIGIGLTSSDAVLHIKGNTYSTVFKVDGTSGELFSITDSLNGSLFSVNDISGLPVLEVFSDNTVNLGDFQARALYTTKKTNVTPGTNNIYSFATASYDGAFIDYTAFDGTNARSGSITAIWMGNQIEFTEISSKDLGDTKSLTFSFVLSGTYAVYGVDASSNWTVKSLIRSI